MTEYYHNIEEEISLGIVKADRVLKHISYQNKRIEELEVKLETYEKYKSEFIRMDRIAGLLADSNDKLEADLAKAVACIQHIATNKITDELTRIEWDTYDTFTVLDACILSARAALAELKEEKNRTGWL